MPQFNNALAIAAVIVLLLVGAAIGARIEYQWYVPPLKLKLAKSELSYAQSAGEYVSYSQGVISQLENQNEKNMAVVNSINSRPVRVFLPCPSPASSEDTAASGVQISTESARLLSERNQQALDGFKQRLDDLQYQADTDIEACRVIQSAANKTCWSN